MLFVSCILTCAGCTDHLPTKASITPASDPSQKPSTPPTTPAQPAGTKPPPEEVFAADKSTSAEDPEARKFLENPVAWLKGCLKRQEDVKGYTCHFTRKERPKGQKHLYVGTMQVEYRDKPFAVRMRLIKGGSRLAREVLFVEGENKNQMVILPSGVLAWGGLAYRNPLDPEVMDGHRNPITSFGLRQTLERSVADWEKLEKEGPLQVRWLGLQKTPELDGKTCQVLLREGASDPDDPVIRAETIWIDPKTGQLVGNRLIDAQGAIVAEYWYNKLENNPTFPPDRFKTSSLK